MIQEAQRLLENQQPTQAQAVAEKAVALRPDRYEAHVLEALSLRDQRSYSQAVHHLQTALALAPEETKPEIFRAITEVRMAGLPPEARRRLDALALVIQDADHASGDERIKLLREFMIRSNAFLEEYSFVADLWLLRASASLELDYPETGWIAGRKLTELGVADSDDPGIRRIMAQLERKGWLGVRLPAKGGEELAGIQIDFSELKQHPRTICLTGPTPRVPLFYCDVIMSLAQNGDGYWQEIVGEVYDGGVYPKSWSTSNDRAEAVRWYQRAGEQGFVSATDRLWRFTQNEADLVHWTRKAADLGFSDAQDVVGRIYLSGWKGAPGAGAVPRDAAEALRWFRKSASQDYAPAEADLGDAYRQGTGVSSDGAEALRWYQRAAQHAADNNTKNRIAWMFATNPDPRFRDGTEAVRLAKAACDATAYKADYIVDTLAAAYAEGGMWDEAIETQQKAIQLAEAQSNDEGKKRAQGYSGRLALYHNHQPYREGESQNLGTSAPPPVSGSLIGSQWQGRMTRTNENHQEVEFEVSVKLDDGGSCKLVASQPKLAAALGHPLQPIYSSACVWKTVGMALYLTVTLQNSAHHDEPYTLTIDNTNMSGTGTLAGNEYSVSLRRTWPSFTEGSEPQSANLGKSAPTPMSGTLIGSEWQGKMTRKKKKSVEEYAVSLKLGEGASCEIVATQSGTAAVEGSVECSWKKIGTALYLKVAMQKPHHFDDSYALTIEGTNITGIGTFGDDHLEYAVSLRRASDLSGDRR